MARRVPTVLLVLLATGGSSLAGCGGDDGGSAPGAAASATSTAIPTATAVPIPTVPVPSVPTAPTPRPQVPAPSAPSAGTTTLESPDTAPPPSAPTITEVQRPAAALPCPSAAGFKSGRTAGGGFDARGLLGLTTARAQALARRNRCVVRVVVRDGRELVRTMDFSNARVNVVETDGRVVALDGIG